MERGGETQSVRARLFVLSAGAINSAVLLLRSASTRHPNGLANSSGAVGRYYMSHNCTALMTLMPLQVNETRFPKTLALNDYYYGGDVSDKPLGNLQMLGKIQEPMLRGALPYVPRWLRAGMAHHSVDWYAMSEDLAHRDSTVRPLASGRIELNWRRTNLRAHHRFVGVAKRLLKHISFRRISKPST